MEKIFLKNISEHFLDLEKRISRVRFARIEASKRLKEKNKRYTMITTLYGIFITFLSIIFSIVNFTDLKFFSEVIIELFNYQQTSVILLAFSSFITMLTLYISNKGYGEKAARFQSNYMELTRLQSDIRNFMVYYKLYDFNEYKRYKKYKESKAATSKNKSWKDLDKRLAKKYRIFADKYAALLTQSENHEDIDYYKACLDETERQIQNLKIEQISYLVNINNSLTSENIEIDAKIKMLSDKETKLNKKINFAKIVNLIKYILLSSFPIIIFLAILLFKLLVFCLVPILS